MFKVKGFAILIAQVWLIYVCFATPAKGLCHHIPDAARIYDSAAEAAELLL